MEINTAEEAGQRMRIAVNTAALIPFGNAPAHQRRQLLQLPVTVFSIACCSSSKNRP